MGVLGGVVGRAVLLIRQLLSRDCPLFLSLSVCKSLSFLRSLSRDVMENFPKLHSTDNASNAQLCIWNMDSKIPRISVGMRAFWEHVFYYQSPRAPTPKINPSRYQFYIFCFRLDPISVYTYIRSRPCECVSVFF